jgi:hypothetical protein
VLSGLSSSCARSEPAAAAAAAEPPRPVVRVASPAVFDGKSLNGWRPIGGAQWKAEGGDLVGIVTNGQGWLVLDQVYGDTGVELSFECDKCEPGVMIRSTTEANRTSGVFFELTGPNAGSLFRVVLDENGREISRKPMPRYTAQVVAEGPKYLITGGCPPVPCTGIRDAHGGGAGSPGSIVAQGAMALRTGTPNTLLFSAGGGNVLTGTFNGTRIPNTIMDDGSMHGRVALKVGGPAGATLRVKRVFVRDYTLRVAGVQPEFTDPRFRKILLSDIFYAEGVGAGDLNRDGHMDVVAGPFYYLGPDFQEARELYLPATINIAGSEYPGGHPTPQVGAITHGNYPPSFMSWVYDFNNDGWNDVFKVMSFGPRPTFSGHIFVNPKGERRHWDNYEVVPLITNEANQFVDVDGDGKPELTMQLATRSNWSDAQVGYSKPDWSDPLKPWTFVPVSGKQTWSGHGLATGDVNGDGRLDLVSPLGWFEQPAKGTTGPWTYHQARYGNGGADIYVYDVNGDKRPDIITSLAAHGPGLAWFEQKADGSFEQHTIMRAPADRTSPDELAFTELHALTLADIDGDGLQDIVTGKRWWSHGYRYDEENDLEHPPVIYWFKLNRSGGKVEYTPHLVNNYSGVGVQLITADIDGNGKPDVLQSARKGTAIFLNQPAR